MALNILNQHKPVLIIGAGPVGLSLALALARKGIYVEVFEARSELSPEIRASTHHPRTLELYHRWGVLDHLLAKGQIVDRLMYWERENRTLIAEMNYEAIGADTDFPYRLQCPQSILIRTLKPLVESLPTAKVHMRHRFTGFREDDDNVTAEFETPDGLKTVQGSFLCGSDGANSTVRKELKLDFSGLTYEDRFLLIAGDLDLKPYFPQIGPVNYMYDPKEWVIILHLPDLVRVVFRMRPDEDEAEARAEPAARERMARFLGRSVPFDIKNISIYRVHQRVASKFRKGRSILLGDAAHINNPAGGMGMNSGIHDADYLAQILEKILVDGDSIDLLDQYDIDRRGDATASIRAYSDKNYADLSATDEAYRQQRNENLRQTAADPARAREYLLRASMLADRI